MTDSKGRYIINNYGRKAGFASFLPGISGEHGIPIWCYYVNRGQCITSFGFQDKDHSIMEFYPAHQAYALTKRFGFRTFLRVDGKVVEPFSDEKKAHDMYIGMNELEIREEDQEHGLDTKVLYFTLPGERVGGLVRRVSIRNTSPKQIHLEALDGMPAVLPYGIDLESMKTMGQTMTAWMQAVYHETGLPFFQARATTKDSARVSEIEGGNYGMAVDETGSRLPVIVDPARIFVYDSSFGSPVALEEGPLTELLEGRQTTQNQVPCCFFAKETDVPSGEELTIYEIYGQAESREILETYVQRIDGPRYFEQKHEEAVRLTDEVTDLIACRTGSEVFDRYCRQSFLDNVLRGGYPVLLGGQKLFYLYSRKHGDIERDYNYFSMLPEFYSQGNGNFRDVNQNRRSDVQFAPFVKDRNIKTFYNCIQINGYNPLGIEKITYKKGNKSSGDDSLPDTFTPGELYRLLEQQTDSREELEKRFAEILADAEYEDRTKFLEGYWTDHWTYNLDLLESYLSVYPEQEHELLFEDCSYTWLQAKEEILPRAKRYEETESGIRQYQFLTANPRAEQMYLTDAEGNVIRSTLAEKLFLLCVVKTVALDACGMGVEMEGGKPGWYDALNGLPALLGSSMCETYEVARTLEYCIEVFKKYGESLQTSEEIAAFAEAICKIMEEEHPETAEGDVLAYWNRINDAKEAYWKQTESCLSGRKRVLSASEVQSMLDRMYATVMHGIEKALACGEGISPAYFYYDVTSYEKDEDGIHPSVMEQHMLPYFLEGPVRWMKLHMDASRKHELYQKVKQSGLYDEQLHMYKVNDSLADSTFELGRCRAFTPGWLENESIWLHMEYKYLLELLKSGMYQEYVQDFYQAAVPFQDPEVYGRSLFENSSFIASSVNPNPAVRGKGFVARLSGSTAEFLQMWQIMMFGLHPFREEQGTLVLKFEPLLPSYLIDETRTVEAAFLGRTRVIYHLGDREDYIPGGCTASKYIVNWTDGSSGAYESGLTGQEALAVRDGKAARIEVYLA